MITPFFVYGTLRVGQALADNWEPFVDRVACGVMVENYGLWVPTHGAFPVALPTMDPGYRVLGDVLIFSDEAKQNRMTELFDRIEGVPHLFRRIAVMLHGPSVPLWIDDLCEGAPDGVAAWMYVGGRGYESGNLPLNWRGSSWLSDPSADMSAPSDGPPIITSRLRVVT